MPLSRGRRYARDYDAVSSRGSTGRMSPPSYAPFRLPWSWIASRSLQQRQFRITILSRADNIFRGRALPAAWKEVPCVQH